MKTVKALLLFALSAVLLPATATAQVQPGTPNFIPMDNHGVDAVDYSNNNIVLSAPIQQRSGIIPFRASLVANSYVLTSGSSWTTPPMANQTVGVVPAFLVSVNGTIGWWTTAYPQSTAASTCNGAATTKYSNWVIVTADGTQHSLPSADYTTSTSGSGCKPTFTDSVIDASGFILSASGPTGKVIQSNGYQYDSHSGVTDANGNTVYWNGCGSGTGTNFCDSLGIPSLKADGGANSGQWTSATGGLPYYSWLDVNGITQTVTPTATSYPVRTAFGCNGLADQTSGSSYFTTQIALADGRDIGFTYEQTPGYATGDTTGRVNQITLPEGGTVTYTHGGPHNGIDCTYQTVPVLTRTLGNGDVTTYTLTHPQIGSTSNYQAVNTVVDPGGNKTVYTFTGFNASGLQSGNNVALTEKQVYQGTSTLLGTYLYSYNTNFTSTPSAVTISQAQVTFPVLAINVYYQPAGMSNWSATWQQFDDYGNVLYLAQYDFGASSPTRATTITYGSCTANCSTTSPTISNASLATNYIFDRPGEIVTAQNGTNVAQTNLTYNSANGNLTSRQVWTGSGFIGQSSSNTYNGNGTPIKVFDLANNETDYTYASGSYSDACGSSLNPLFPTKVKNVGTGLYTQATYDCQGGVKLKDIDANGNTVTYGYTNGSTGDPYFRVVSVTDQYSAVVYKTYPTSSSPTTSGSSFTFNSGNSIEGGVSTVDAYGRPIDGQRYQSPGGSDYDTWSTSYGWSGNYFQVQTSEPCLNTLSATCSSYAHTSKFDPAGRLYTASTTNNETVTNTYAQNDVLSALTPVSSGENSKRIQTEYDGLGRVSKICHIGSTASTGSGTSCSQNTGSASGATDAYTYGQGSGYTTVTVKRNGGQTRTNTYDALGRLTQKVTPEGGTWTYNYDTADGCTASNGNLTESSDPNGNGICYYYDALNRLIEESANTATIRYYVYDTNYGTIPSGVSTPTNPLGSLTEAYTTVSGTLTTDEWFSRDKDHRVTDYYQSTPHSTQYYHSKATFADNGAVTALQLASPSLYTMNFGLDGEGRKQSAAIGFTTMVDGTVFNAAGNPTQVNLISGSSDWDQYSWDQYTGRMTGYTFTVNSTNLVGSVYWNPNGTLEKIATTDGFNAGGTLTCKSDPTGLTGYDDWSRLLTFDCGSGNWGQTFTYDIYDNLTKAQESSHTGTSWNPGYSSSNNQFTGGTFDSNGNTKADGAGNYWGWNEFSKNSWWNTSSVAPTCGSGGKCITYDAFGRMVEQSNSGNFKEYWYTQAGTAQMIGSGSIVFGYWPVSSAGTVIVVGNAVTNTYAHNDWLGNARIVSTHARTVSADQAYTPYGEIFASYGSPASYDDVFAGIPGNFNNGVQWDAPNRELAIFSRWLSPDPIGAGWNQYAYPTNPNSFVDPSGLDGHPVTCMSSSGCNEGTTQYAGGSGAEFGFLDMTCYNCGPGDSGYAEATTAGYATSIIIIDPSESAIDNYFDYNLDTTQKGSSIFAPEPFAGAIFNSSLTPPPALEPCNFSTVGCLSWPGPRWVGGEGGKPAQSIHISEDDSHVQLYLWAGTALAIAGYKYAENMILDIRVSLSPNVITTTTLLDVIGAGAIAAGEAVTPVLAVAGALYFGQTNLSWQEKQAVMLALP